VRECGECTACCEGMASRRESRHVLRVKACAHCRSEGCAIYETRPEEPCRTFKCAWLQDEWRSQKKCGRINVVQLCSQQGTGKEWNVMRAMPVGP
jgi:hypothetical protein